MNTLELREKFPYFFKVFPEAIIEFALSEKTAQKIANICIENHITDEEKIKKTAFYVTFVIFDISPKEILPNILEEKIGFTKEISQKIAMSIDELILSKLPSLEENKEKAEKLKKETSAPSSQKIEKDTYREKI
jgi:hypothetical protein